MPIKTQNDLPVKEILERENAYKHVQYFALEVKS